MDATVGWTHRKPWVAPSQGTRAGTGLPCPSSLRGTGSGDCIRPSSRPRVDPGTSALEDMIMRAHAVASRNLPSLWLRPPAARALTALLVTVVLAACGGGDGDDGGSSPFGPATLTVTVSGVAADTALVRVDGSGTEPRFLSATTTLTNLPSGT